LSRCRQNINFAIRIDRLLREVAFVLTPLDDVRLLR
jgi:hypothetical protein